MTNVTLMLTIEVKNFDEWKVNFDNGKSIRDKAEIKVLNIFRSVENENLVTVVEEAKSEQAAKDFLAGLKAVMEKTGASKPEIKILKKVE